MPESLTRSPQENNWVNSSAAIAPALFGAAAGIFLSDLIRSETRRPLSYTFAALGLFALAPSLVENVVEKVNGPNSQRGSQRTLNNIRYGGTDTEEFSEIEDELESEMHII